MSGEQPTRDQIFVGVRDSLVESLAVEPDEIHEDALLVQDLGLASIDMLDLLFSLNTTFDTYIRPAEIQSQLLGGLSEAEFLNADRTVSDRGYERIAELVPGFDRAGLTEELTDADLFEFFRVRHVIDLVQQKLAEKTDES